MGNFFFLPICIVCGFCALVSFPDPRYGWRQFFFSKDFSVYAALASLSFLLWWISRRPRALLFFAEGSILAVLDAIWAGWILHSDARLPAAVNGISGRAWAAFGILWAMTVFAGMGTASIRCFQCWALLRRADPAKIEEDVRRIGSQN